jgi:hypothetical protein
LKCPSISLTPSLSTVPNGNEENSLWVHNQNICDLPHLRNPIQCQYVKNNSPKKVCIFFHGTGQTKDEPISSTFHGYWGKIENFTPQCSSRIFVHRNTKSRGWNSKELQNYFCETALMGEQNKNSTLITNKIIFAHSMGNLILAEAIRNGICDIGNNTSWYSIAAPYLGSKAVSFVTELCKKNLSYSACKNAPAICKLVAEIFGYCEDKGNDVPACYKSLMIGNPVFPKLIEIVKRRIKGMVCGTDAFVLTSFYSVPMNWVSQMVNFTDSDDGFVNIGSCNAWKANLSENFNSLK